MELCTVLDKGVTRRYSVVLHQIADWITTVGFRKGRLCSEEGPEFLELETRYNDRPVVPKFYHYS